jgi:hypothetical protein
MEDLISSLGERSTAEQIEEGGRGVQTSSSLSFCFFRVGLGNVFLACNCVGLFCEVCGALIAGFLANI